MRKLLLLLVILLGLTARPAFAQDEFDIPPEMQQLVDSLSPRQGAVELTAAEATLDLGDRYDFYGADDARRILVELWGNHPDEATGVLGMIMPAGESPVSSPWGAVVKFEPVGWVSNEDARETDYGEVLASMQEGARELNATRQAQGYPAVEIVGWAQSPEYDSVNHSVIWARELAFSDSDLNTLNYDLRTLGRHGVLSVNMIAGMDQLPEISLAASQLAGHTSFDPGARYEDYDSSTDEAAGYGIAGLIAGGAGAAVAKKASLFAILLKFLKPILIALFVALAVFSGKIKRMFAGGSDEEEEWQGNEEDGHLEDAYPEARQAMDHEKQDAPEPEPEPDQRPG